MEDYREKNNIFRSWLSEQGFACLGDDSRHQINWGHPSGLRVSVCFSPCAFGVRIFDKHRVHNGRTTGRSITFEKFKEYVTKSINLYEKH